MYTLKLERRFRTPKKIIDCWIKFLCMEEKPYVGMKIKYEGLRAKISDLTYDIVNNVWVDTKRGLGYAPHNFDVSVEELINFGWVIENVKDNPNPHRIEVDCDEKPY